MKKIQNSKIKIQNSDKVLLKSTCPERAKGVEG